MGWIANIFLVAGLLLIGRKWRHAFALTAIGEVLWTVECCTIGRWDMISLCGLFAVIAVYNWWQWTRPTEPGDVLGV